MANTFSAIKRERQDEKRTLVNRARKTRLRHGIRKIRRLITSKDAEQAAKALPEAFSLIDKSAKVGIIKKNTAARYKSKLTLRVRALQPANQ